MKPILTQKRLPPDVTAVVDRQRGQATIRTDIDLKFRRALLEAARQRGGAKALRHISNALELGPSRGGAAEVLGYFGWTTLRNPTLVATAPIIEGLEVTVPGFKRWLEITNYANDKNMIKGFVAWSEHTLGQGHVIPEAKRAADDNRSS